jgi:dipeptide/tripeptide permease
MLAEELAVEDRARGQSYAALAGSFGAGLCILVMPLLARSIYSWRLLFGISALGLRSGRRWCAWCRRAVDGSARRRPAFQREPAFTRSSVQRIAAVPW